MMSATSQLNSTITAAKDPVIQEPTDCGAGCRLQTRHRGSSESEGTACDDSAINISRVGGLGVAENNKTESVLNAVSSLGER